MGCNLNIGREGPADRSWKCFSLVSSFLLKIIAVLKCQQHRMPQKESYTKYRLDVCAQQLNSNSYMNSYFVHTAVKLTTAT